MHVLNQSTTNHIYCTNQTIALTHMCMVQQGQTNLKTGLFSVAISPIVYTCSNDLSGESEELFQDIYTVVAPQAHRR